MAPKPIKRNENLVPVSREHHATLLFCWKLREGVKKATEPARITAYIEWFWESHIKSHFQTEETLLFIDHADAMTQRALDEHKEIQHLIENIMLLKEKSATESILKLAELVNNHTRYEERELFPWLEQKFSAEALAEIGMKLHSEKHDAEEVYKDEFWLKENTQP